MAYSLSESAKLSQNQLVRGVIESMVEDQPLLQTIPFVEVEGNAYSYNRENALPNAAFRAVNAAYTESSGTFSNVVVPLAILGGDSDVDRFLAQTRSNINDIRAEALRAKSKSVAREFQSAFVNGTTGGNGFDGLNALLDTTAQEISAATNGLPIIGSSVADQHAFFDKLDEAIAAVDGTPSIILVNAPVLAKIQSSARRLTSYTETKTDFGQLVMTYQGIPVVNIGDNASGSPIIPQTETQGSSSVASSIYVARFDATNGVAGLTNGGVQAYDLGEQDSKPVYRTCVEFYAAIAMHSAKSAAVLRGVLAS